MAPGQTMLMLMIVLVLSSFWLCRAMPAPEPVQWVWGTSGAAQAEPLLLSRSKRDNGKQEPSVTTLEHGHTAPTLLSTNETLSPESNLLLGSAPPAGAASTNASLHQALVVPTTASSLEEADSPEPDLLLSSAPPLAPSTKASLSQGFAVPTTADLQEETESSDPDLLLSSVPPAAASTNLSLHQTLVVPTPADLQEETESSDPDLLLSSVPSPVPSTQAAPQKSITTVLKQLTSPGEEVMVAGGTDNSSVTLPALVPTTTAYKEAESPLTPTHPTPWDTTPEGTTVPMPWDPKGTMSKCLLAMLLLALVAATFMVCTGVLGTLLWRRARTARRRFSHTEMICISSLLPDREVTTNGPRPGPARRPKLLLDGGSEADGDNLTLSSFLPEHS